MAVEGLDRLIEKLDKLENIEVEPMLNRCCVVVENAAKQKCPVASGQLRSSITHKVEGNEGKVGTNVEYAPYVEYGTGVFATKGGGRTTPWRYCDANGKWHTTTGRKSRPFMMPALRDNRGKVLEEMRKAIKEALK